MASEIDISINTVEKAEQRRVEMIIRQDVRDQERMELERGQIDREEKRIVFEERHIEREDFAAA